MVAAAVGIGTAVAGLGAAAISSNAASNASSAQQAAAQAGISEQQREFDAIQQLLQPYVGAGTSALTAQGNLTGLNGAGPQQAAITALEGSPYFTAMQAQGTNSILANASATGGLRGGNVNAALAQFTPGLLAQTIQQQYGNLGGIASMGQNAAAGVGNAGLTTGQGIASLLQQQGAAQAGGYLANSAAAAGGLNSVGGGLSAYLALSRMLPSPVIPGVTNGSNPNGYMGTINNPSAYVSGGGF